MTDRQSLKRGPGPYAVYAAVRSDPALKGTLQATSDGKLIYNGSRMTEYMFSEIAVYLEKEHGVNTSRWALHAGLVSAAASIPKAPRKRSEIEISDEYIESVRRWLSEHEPGDDNLSITTESVAKSVDGENYGRKRRATEMKVATVLRRLGLEPCRIMLEGKRKYRWFPA